MKSVVKKKEAARFNTKSKEALCCAKVSKNTPGCHD